jgi:hypothetical protein
VRRFAAHVGLIAAFAAIGSGCAEMQTAQQAVAAAQVATQAAQAIPAAIQSVADAFALNNGVNWGRPAAIVVTDTQYVLLYPTPLSEQKAGRPRIIVVNRNDGYTQFGPSNRPY